jgi:alpha-D-xyloside xylohydrolase
MKFSNGYWLLKPGVEQFYLADVRDTVIEPTRITMFVAPFKVYNRGQTLAGPLLTLVFNAPCEGVLQISMSHYIGGAKKGPEFNINDQKQTLSMEETETEYIIRSGQLSAHIDKNNFVIEYRYAGRFLTSSVPRGLAYLTTPDGPYCRDRLQISVGENFYGFGERFTPFVKNGQVVDIWNEDGGTASDQAYKNIPFCISSRGYGIFVNHPEKVSYEVGSEAVSRLQFSVPGEHLRYMIIGGDNLDEVISHYTHLTGRPALPPAWSYGLWLSTSFTTNYNEETVTSFIDGMLARDIPLDVFHFDCFWMKEYEWCNFTWDTDAFPDPAGILSRLKEKGLKICVWINSYIGQKSPLFAEAADKGYLIKDRNGGVWQWDLWQPGMGIVDFTNPEAVVWYQSHLRRLMDEGVDCFKTDFGERIPVECKYFDGSDPYKMHNYYTQLFNKAVFDVLEEVKGKNEAVLFARSATAGGQQFPVHWGGDCEATYESMAESLRGGLSLAVCGFGFWSHDISGFENTATPDLYKRWVAFGLFSSHSRLHGSSSYRVPWNFDDESSDVLRFFTKYKLRLMPYIYAASVAAHEKGLPAMRPMVMDFYDDPVCQTLDRQYMFGPNILVAPVFNAQGETQTYLPEGIWTHLFTGEAVEGGRYVNATYDYFGLPVYVKPNSIIAMGRDENPKSAVYEYHENPVLHAYEINEQGAEAAIVDRFGKLRYKVLIKMVNGETKITVDGKHDGFTVRLYGKDAKTVEMPLDQIFF